MYWDETNQIWTQNIVIPVAQQTSYTMPSVGYCPSPDELLQLYNSNQLSYENNKYYYYINDDERFTLNIKNGVFTSIKYQQDVGFLWSKWENKWDEDLKWYNEQIWTRKDW